MRSTTLGRRAAGRRRQEQCRPVKAALRRQHSDQGPERRRQERCRPVKPALRQPQRPAAQTAWAEGREWLARRKVSVAVRRRVRAA
jgi:hypothetical protein